jgi:hypothetical protein
LKQSDSPYPAALTVTASLLAQENPTLRARTAELDEIL